MLRPVLAGLKITAPSLAQNNLYEVFEILIAHTVPLLPEVIRCFEHASKTRRLAPIWKSCRDKIRTNLAPCDAVALRIGMRRLPLAHLLHPHVAPCRRLCELNIREYGTKLWAAADRAQQREVPNQRRAGLPPYYGPIPIEV